MATRWRRPTFPQLAHDLDVAADIKSTIFLLTISVRDSRVRERFYKKD